jgi:psp operon transcriptional activator
LGDSESLLKAKERLSRAAKVDRPVLILGGRGTGKELAAARLHFLSPRWKGPYVTLNCAALAPGLLDSELFGHEAGSFTGASRRRPGRFEAADGGTLFLDEISHLTIEAQARILRVVEYGGFQMVGSAAERRVDVRIVAATNADLRQMCRQGTFLDDLWDRLSFEIIELPPLKDRPGDISLLAHYFGARMARELGWESAPVLSPEVLSALEAYDWPGNVRELKNVIERAVYHQSFEGSEIAPEDLGLESALEARQSPAAASGALDIPLPSKAAPGPSMAAAGPLKDRPELSELLPLGPGGFEAMTRQYAKSLIDAAMDRAGHHQGRAAELLGLSYHKFRALRRKLGFRRLSG